MKHYSKQMIVLYLMIFQFYYNMYYVYFIFKNKHYIKKESPNTYEEIDKIIKDILANKITKEHLTNYLKHSYKIYKS